MPRRSPSSPSLWSVTHSGSLSRRSFAAKHTEEQREGAVDSVGSYEKIVLIRNALSASFETQQLPVTKPLRIAHIHA